MDLISSFNHHCRICNSSSFRIVLLLLIVYAKIILVYFLDVDNDLITILLYVPISPLSFLTCRFPNTQISLQMLEMKCWSWLTTRTPPPKVRRAWIRASMAFISKWLVGLYAIVKQQLETSIIMKNKIKKIKKN